MIKPAGTEWGFPGEFDKTAPILQFRSDGKVSGSTSCNRVTGFYSEDRDGLTLWMLATTRMACRPDVMERERQFLTILEEVRRVEVSRSKLTLKETDGNILGELRRRDADWCPAKSVTSLH